MATKNKKAKTPSQLVKRYKRISRLSFAGIFVSTITPYIVIGIVNYQKYFVEVEGWKITTGGSLAIAIMGLSAFLVAKKKFNPNFASLVISWAIVDFILFLINDIINQIATIMFFGWFGILAAYGCNKVSEIYDEKAKKIKSGISKAEDELTAAAYKEELAQKEAKKVKIKIVKNKKEEQENEQV